MGETKVYVVMPDYGYEGFGDPEGCFADETSAEEFAAKQTDFYKNERVVFELEVQKIPQCTDNMQRKSER